LYIPAVPKLPPLPLDEWAPAYQTLHRWTQIVGKTRLSNTAMQNHWWNATLYVTARGLTTSTIPYKRGVYEVEFDFVDHLLLARTSTGDIRSLELERRSVADFYAGYTAMLDSLGIEPRIRGIPCELPDTLPFAEDNIHADYDPDAANRSWQILAYTDRIFKDFRSGFLGKCSPVHFWWGAFDLACTRFSGRRAPVHPGGIPNLPDWVTREAYSHECYSCGWWPGTVGGPVAEPAFYAYAYAEPDGFSSAKVAPASAYYHPEMREWFLPYEPVRASADPDDMLLSFLDSTYGAAADLGRWERQALERPH
jgi:hypothetical protein